MSVQASVGVTALIIVRALTAAGASLRASLLVHKDMVARVMRAPTTWFDQTPVGRVQNRFSSDMEVRGWLVVPTDKRPSHTHVLPCTYLPLPCVCGWVRRQTIDKNLMDSLTSFVECLLNAAAVAVVVSARMPPLLAGMLPILGLALWVGHCYLKSSRELKRLESTTRSPIYIHLSESVAGVSSVRAYGLQQPLIRESEQRVDRYGQVDFMRWAATRWLSLRLQMLGAASSGMVGVYILASLPTGAMSSTSAGLTLLYANSFSAAMNWLIRNQAELEMNMNSMVRT
jgi:ABC-type multidrug transport system fused ATPase/permease subunit